MHEHEEERCLHKEKVDAYQMRGDIDMIILMFFLELLRSKNISLLLRNYVLIDISCVKT